jgi:hypothetical protein
MVIKAGQCCIAQQQRNRSGAELQPQPSLKPGLCPNHKSEPEPASFRDIPIFICKPAAWTPATEALRVCLREVRSEQSGVRGSAPVTGKLLGIRGFPVVTSPACRPSNPTRFT